MDDCLTFIVYDNNNYFRSGIEALITGGVFKNKRFIQASSSVDEEIDVAFIRVKNGDSFCLKNFLLINNLKAKKCILINDLPKSTKDMIKIHCELYITVIHPSMEKKTVLSTVEYFVKEGLSGGVGGGKCMCQEGFFTKREKEVIHYLTLGLRTKDVSRNLGISEKTVSNHKLSAMRKLSCRGSASFAKHLRLIGGK